jgi:ribosomal protein S18 acetylase RimI-like enzyme
MIEIRPAQLPADIPRARSLFREYAEGLGIDLGFQDFAAELDSLPGRYAPPRGRLMLAWDGDSAVGCVALRPVDGETCEMKRLYVQPAARAQRLGRRLAERICREACEAGYRRMCLDTLPAMAPAIRLYCALGFRPIEPYVFNPIEGALFLGLDLQSRRVSDGTIVSQSS